MKKYLLLLLLAGLFAACEQDEFPTDHKPIIPGDEILFGSVLPEEGPATKTEYGDLVVDGKNKYFPVYWTANDNIAVCCPEAVYPTDFNAPGYRKLADYAITPNTTEGLKNVAAQVTKSSDRVLQWSDAPVHHFYAVYPAKAVHSTEAYSFFSTVSENQKAVDVVPMEGDANTFIVQPDMENALMFADTTYDRAHLPAAGKVELNFKPFSTVLEITIPGSVDNTQQFHISRVTVTSGPKGKPICGRYQYKFNDAGDFDGAISLDSNKVNNTITASTSLPDGVALNAKQKAVYKIFLGPEVGPKDILTVIIGTEYGNLRKVLDKTEIQPGKVNRVTLPFINREKANNNWISDLNPDIYLTELSIPGSKMSLVDTYQSLTANTFESQLKDGLRAFVVQTCVKNNKLMLASEDGSLDYPVDDYILNISNFLTKKENKGEFAFVMFTYSPDGLDTKAKRTEWVQKLKNTIDDWVTKGYSIYPKEITPETTIKDVAGTMILKANYNTTDMENAIKTNTMPSLFSLWDKACHHEIKGNDTIVLSRPLYWGTTANPATMEWYYQEVTKVSDKSADFLIRDGKYIEKLNFMKYLLKKGVLVYNQPGNHHKSWFFNDLGGRFMGIEAAGSERKQLAKELSQQLHPVAIKILRERKQNAALGLIMMNFANRLQKTDSGLQTGTITGDEVKSDWLIQTVIDNNFKFPLRRKVAPVTPSNPDPKPVLSTKSETSVYDEWDN